MIRSALETAMGKAFEWTILYPIKLGHFFAGDRIWPPLANLSSIASKNIGKFINLILPEYEHDPILRAIASIDLFEDFIGIHGNWERIDEKTAFKRIYECKLAAKWGKANKFCTIIGDLMGKEMLRPIYSNQTIHYEIKSVLSQGAPCCEYYLHLK